MLLTAVGKSLILWFAIFTVLTTLVIVLRFWAMRVKRRALRLDDYMVAFAFVSAIDPLSSVGISLTRDSDQYTCFDKRCVVGDCEWSRCTRIRAHSI